MVVAISHLIGCTNDVGNDQGDKAEAQVSVIDLMKEGKPEACSAKAVKDEIVGRAFPEKPDDMPFSSWETLTSDFNLSVDKTRVIKVDMATAQIDCAAYLIVKSDDESGELPIHFSLARNLDDDKSFLMSMNSMGANAFVRSKGIYGRISNWRRSNLNQGSEIEENSEHALSQTEQNAMDAANNAMNAAMN